MQHFGAFGHDNRVVDDDADRHQDRKHADQIEREAQCRHRTQRSQHRYRNAPGDPPRNACIHEQKQDQQHEHDALQTVLDNHPHALRRLVGKHVIHVDFQRRRQFSPDLVDVGSDHLLRFDGIDPGRTHDHHADGLVVAGTA